MRLVAIISSKTAFWRYIDAACPVSPASLNADQRTSMCVSCMLSALQVHDPKAVQRLQIGASQCRKKRQIIAPKTRTVAAKIASQFVVATGSTGLLSTAIAAPAKGFITA
jgi:hypothetical protein